VNYTDTQLSHRFMRFSVPDKNIEKARQKAGEFIREIFKSEMGTLHYKIQEDEDITGEKGEILSAGKARGCSNMTVCVVCDPLKNENPVQPFRELVKNNFEFMEEVQGAKTSIGRQVFLKESDIAVDPYQQNLCAWAD